jgi:hypothetical protein
MGFIIKNDVVHKIPPANGCKASIAEGKIVDALPRWAEKCYTCFAVVKQ